MLTISYGLSSNWSTQSNLWLNRRNISATLWTKPLGKPEPDSRRHWVNCTSSVVLTKFTNSLVKSRPLKEVGAEQLLIDLQALKTALLRIPGEDLTTSKYVCEQL